MNLLSLLAAAASARRSASVTHGDARPAAVAGDRDATGPHHDFARALHDAGAPGRATPDTPAGTGDRAPRAAPAGARPPDLPAAVQIAHATPSVAMALIGIVEIPAGAAPPEPDPSRAAPTDPASPTKRPPRSAPAEAALPTPSAKAAAAPAVQATAASPLISIILPVATGSRTSPALPAESPGAGGNTPPEGPATGFADATTPGSAAGASTLLAELQARHPPRAPLPARDGPVVRRDGETADVGAAAPEGAAANDGAGRPTAPLPAPRSWPATGAVLDPLPAATTAPSTRATATPSPRLEHQVAVPGGDASPPARPTTEARSTEHEMPIETATVSSSAAPLAGGGADATNSLPGLPVPQRQPVVVPVPAPASAVAVRDSGAAPADDDGQPLLAPAAQPASGALPASPAKADAPIPAPAAPAASPRSKAPALIPSSDAAPARPAEDADPEGQAPAEVTTAAPAGTLTRDTTTDAATPPAQWPAWPPAQTAAPVQARLAVHDETGVAAGVLRAPDRQQAMTAKADRLPIPEPTTAPPAVRTEWAAENQPPAPSHGLPAATADAALTAVALATPSMAPAATQPGMAAAPVAEGRMTAGPGSPEFAAELGSQLTTFVRDGVQHARLHLNPAELGPVTVQIQIDGQAAQVHLAAEHGLTRQALEQSMPLLAGSLREAGLTLSGGGVFEQPRQQREPAPQGTAADSRPGAERGDESALRPGPTVVRRRGVVDLVA